MSQTSYRERDYGFGQTMLTLRTAAGLTQAGLAELLGVSRRAVGEWESGSKYPNAAHLQAFIHIALEHHAFPAAPLEAQQQIRALWQAAHQKVLLDEAWLAALTPSPQKKDSTAAVTPPSPNEPHPDPARQVTFGLPFQPTPIIGRAAELAQINRLLSDSACRLLTLLGPGGIGKTRLALRVAVNQSANFQDGVAFVALAAMDTAPQIISAIGDTLKLTLDERTQPAAQLIEYLSTRHILLILDDLEHLPQSAELINQILAGAPRVTVLVTSRERLYLQAEWLFDVQGLAYPIGESDTEALANYSAVQLFIQRATQVLPNLALSEAALVAIAHICQYTAGMPLAIELAAANVRVLPVIEIARQIRSNLDLLATPRRDMPARHRSMRAVFDHSWNLLSESEKGLFSRLAVFRGGWTMAASMQVAGATIQTLSALIDKSLVRASGDEASSAVEPRFFLLEPIREYALEQLAGRGETEAMQRAHAQYYLGLAEAAASQWDSPAADTLIHQLDPEQDNLRAAMQTARRGDRTLGLGLGGSLWQYWRRRGQGSEGRVWLEELLSEEDDSSDPTSMSARRRALDGAAWLASYQHDFLRATRLFEQSLTLRRALGEVEDPTHLLDNAARHARSIGEYRRATTLFEDALALHRALGDRGRLGALGLSLYELGLVLREQGNFERATALFEECLQLHRELQDQEGIGIALLGLADVARDRGDVPMLRRYATESLEILEKLGVQWAIGFAQNNLALAAYLSGDLETASALINASVTQYRAQKAEGSLAEVLVTQGIVRDAQGDIAGAYHALMEALQLARAVGPRLLIAAALETLAEVANQLQKAEQAAQLLATATQLRAQMGTPVSPAYTPLLERTLASARTMLGADRFAALTEQAQAIPLQEFLQSLPNAFTLPARSIATPALAESGAAPRATRVDWNDAVKTPNFYGREWELALLTEWVVEERCRVVSVLGLGGIGKSALAAHLMHQVANHFDVVIWRSLRDIPNCETLLDECLQTFAPPKLSDGSLTLEQRQALLLEHMRHTRMLLVYDNLESVLAEGENAGQMLAGFEGLGHVLRLAAETEHQSCILLTSREKLIDLAPLEGSRVPVRSLRLTPLEANACEQLLTEKGVQGTPAERATLIETYGGNPLALKIVAQTITDLFDGEVQLFLQQGRIIFGGVRDLLRSQFDRLAPLPQSILLWLAILREPTTLDELLAVLVSPVPRAELLEAMEALYRRSLVEKGHTPGTFTLQSVVLEYITARLINELSQDIAETRLAHLLEHGIQLARVSDNVRQSQERLILTPIVARLQSDTMRVPNAEEPLLALLTQLKTMPLHAQGYAPANLVALLRVLRGNLQQLDLSHLSLRGVYLQGVEMQDTTLAGSLIADSVFTDSFDVMTSVAISGDGKYWAAASRRGEIRVWAAGGLTMLRVWRAHTDMIWTLAFSPDGRTLASGSWDGLVKVWNVEDGNLLWFGTHTSHINCVAFSRDGKWLASVGLDEVVRIWDVQTHGEIQTLPHIRPISEVTWSPDNRLLALSDVEGSIRIWQLNGSEPATLVHTLEGHSQWVNGIDFSPDGSTLASASWDGTVKLWNVASASVLETLTGHTDRVHHVYWSPDGLTLASSSRDKTVLLWDVPTRRYRAVLRGHSGGVNGLAFTPDSRSLLTGSEDGTLRVWEIAHGECLRVIQGYAAALYDVDWSPDGTQLVSGSTDYAVTLYDATGATLPRVLRGHDGIVYSVAWSPDGRWVVSSEWNEVDDALRMWDPVAGKLVRRFQSGQDTGGIIHDVAWSPDGRYLAIGSLRRGPIVLDANSLQPLWETQPFPVWIRNVQWNPAGTLLAGGSDHGLVYVWDAASGALVQELTGHHSMITRVAWSPDGTRLASGGYCAQGGELFVWDVSRAERIQSLRGHPGIVNAVAWGSSSNLLVSGGSDGALYWWDVARGESIQISPAHNGSIQALRASRDRNTLASCGDDGAIMLWDTQTSAHLRTLRRDRPYERLDITGIRGLTQLQQETLRSLGAIEQ